MDGCGQHAQRRRWLQLLLPSGSHGRPVLRAVPGVEKVRLLVDAAAAAVNASQSRFPCRSPSPNRARNSLSSRPLTLPSLRVTAAVVGPPAPATRSRGRSGGWVAVWAPGKPACTLHECPAHLGRRRATATRAPAPSPQRRSASALHYRKHGRIVAFKQDARAPCLDVTTRAVRLSPTHCTQQPNDHRNERVSAPFEFRNTPCSVPF
jgi:hypothetical protein